MTGRHLRRLDEIWVTNPIYFITTCAEGRLRRLANDDFHAIAIEVWRNCEEHYGWTIGRYVIMPDHVHFFAYDSHVERTLSEFVGKWKEWTAKYCRRRLGFMMPLWQPEFFDHVLRSSQSYEEKWEYVRSNPIRAGLARSADEWKYQGEVTQLRCD
jgi:REP element-mobilizing transposase RayT